MPAKFMTVALPPPPEYGIHRSIYANAAKLRDYGATYESTISAMFRWKGSHAFRRAVQKNEIIDAVNAVYRRPRQNGAPNYTKGFGRSGVSLPYKTWPKPDPDQRAQIIDPNFGLYDLWEASPVRFGDTKPHTREVLEALFPNDPLMCCGWSKRRFETKRLSEWCAIERMQFIVPNPMSSPLGRVQNSERLSARTKENTGARRFLVIDYDDAAGPDVHASASGYLSQYYPLALALFSGGKSLHAWYYVANATQANVRAFMTRASLLGGDPAMFNVAQFCRMPDGIRDNGKRQTVYYFNPEVVK
jgi:hypothetical protein